MKGNSDNSSFTILEVIDLIFIFGYSLALIALSIIAMNFLVRPENRAYFLTGVGFKLMGALGFALIYKLYYGAGDTFGYFRSIAFLREVFFQDPWQSFELLTSNKVALLFDSLQKTEFLGSFDSPSIYGVARCGFIPGILGGGNFFAITLLFSYCCFWGLWLLYKTADEIFPNQRFILFLAIFCMPSVVFWGSGILKDTITLGALGVLFWSFHHLFIKRKLIIISAILFLLSFLIIAQIKIYIALATLPALLYWLGARFLRPVSGHPVYLFSASIFLIFIFAYAYFFQSSAIRHFADRLLEVFIDKALDFQGWHGFLAQTSGAYGYDLGEIEFTYWGILKKAPASIFIALYRPFIFEASKIVHLISGVENAVLLLLTFFVWIKVGFFSFWRIIFSNNALTAFLIFVLIFSFMVGFTSYNFGALVRYKIPCIPFFGMLLLLPLVLHSRTKSTDNSTNSQSYDHSPSRPLA